MSITDELRLFAADPYTGWVPTDKQQADLRAIADRIDAEHESACAEAYSNGVQSVALPDMTAYVKLPVDADDVPIHAGDVLDGYGKTIEVVELRYGRSGWVLISRDGNGYADTFAFTHHHADSWERIIEDARTCTGSAGNYTAVPSMRWTNEVDALVARCKALAGDAE